MNFPNTVYGFQIDYLIPTLYLTDIVAILIIIFGLGSVIARRFGRRSNLKADYFTYVRNDRHFKKYFIFTICYMVFAGLNICLSDYFISSIYRWFKVTEMLLLGLVVFNTRRFNVFNNFVKPLSYSIFVICLLGIWQYFIESSVGGLFYFLGERSFLFSNPNTAPYPYSTFSHPNSFAGFLLVFGIFLLQYKNKFGIKHFWITTSLVAINLVLTNSLNVYITIGLLLFLKMRGNLAFSFLAFSYSDRFISHRIELIQASFKMVKENFWIGVGLNNFVPNLVKVSNTFVNAWELQPVHNIFLLVFSELGFIGLIFFVFVLFSGIQLFPIPYALYAILASGQFDHYWLTLQQNMLLFTYVLVISRKWKNKK